MVPYMVSSKVTNKKTKGVSNCHYAQNITNDFSNSVTNYSTDSDTNHQECHQLYQTTPSTVTPTTPPTVTPTITASSLPSEVVYVSVTNVQVGLSRTYDESVASSVASRAVSGVEGATAEVGGFKANCAWRKVRKAGSSLVALVIVTHTSNDPSVD